MKYCDVCGEKISRLAFGTMRMPLKNGELDLEQIQAMTDYAIENGVNYFDTAWPYHDGKSELAIGKALAKYPRDSYFLADKYPGHQVMSDYDCAGIFEKQLQKCGVEYFDFYLLHNINEMCIDVYKDPQWGILDYFIEQKRLGRIKHLGMSTHARARNLNEMLDYMGDNIEFCQIQLNYLDWTLQEAKDKVAELNRRNIPIWVMEPVRGGKLADLGEYYNTRLKNLRPDESVASWAFRWLMQVEGVATILSGMSDMDQMKDNIKTFSKGRDLTQDEFNMLLDIAEGLKVGVPCTGCGYCLKGCPQKLDIPMLIAGYNDQKYQAGVTVGIQMDGTPHDKWPDKCIGCGACLIACPQKINIPDVMKEFYEMLTSGKSWTEICKEREAAAKNLSL